MAPGQRHLGPAFYRARSARREDDKAVAGSTNPKAGDLGSSSQPDPDLLRGSSSPSLSSLIQKMVLRVESNHQGRRED